MQQVHKFSSFRGRTPRVSPYLVFLMYKIVYLTISADAIIFGDSFHRLDLVRTMYGIIFRFPDLVLRVASFSVALLFHQ